MCGRFALAIPPEVLAAFFELESIPEQLEPRFNIAPTQDVGVIRLSRHGARRFGPVRWGLVPHWAKDDRAGARMINARRETLATKSSFREAYRRRRCLIPASGFYEWRRRGKERLPYFARSREGDPLALAGLWERWRDPRRTQHSPIDTCTIITTPATEPLQTIHDRAPAVVPRHEWPRWLGRDALGDDALQEMLEPPATLEIYAVSALVNNVGFDAPACVERRDGRKR